MANLAPASLPSTWGVRPVLFSVGEVPVDSYGFFMGLAIILGILVFVWLARKEKRADERSFYILLAALVGGTLGAKIPLWITNYPMIVREWPDLTPVLSGRTIVGGLIGGTLAVWWVKHRLKIRRRIGNAIAPAIALGIAVGRWGCFLRGCCYGLPTTLPWGVDFGDGIARHPTQLYESLFGAMMFLLLLLLLRNKPREGALLSLFMISYFIFRFLLEFIRVEPRLAFGLTGYQFAALAVLVYYAIKAIRPSRTPLP